MAHPAGFEPATIRLEGGCSIQLSYGRFISASFRSADFKLRLVKTLIFKSRLTQQQAVLDKRGACYREAYRSSTLIPKKFQLDKGVTGIPERATFAVSPQHARMRVLFLSLSMVNQAS
jgi:hypothetical protein